MKVNPGIVIFLFALRIAKNSAFQPFIIDARYEYLPVRSRLFD
jgi:hypothetical protein